MHLEEDLSDPTISTTMITIKFRAQVFQSQVAQQHIEDPDCQEAVNIIAQVRQGMARAMYRDEEASRM